MTGEKNDIGKALEKIYERLGFVVLWLFFIMVACCEMAGK